MSHALKPIPLFRPSYGDREKRYLAGVLDAGWSGMGPLVDKFESKFATLCGAKYAVAVNSCTSALKLAYRYLMQSLGAYLVEAPALTFVSTAQAALEEGIAVRFSDVESDSLVRSIPISEGRSTIQTVVHYGGQHWTQDGFNVVHDAAHCSPLEFEQPPSGLVCWSFEAKKIISCGDGGMITTNSMAEADTFRRWRWCGITRSTWERSGSKYQWDYDIPELGEKCHMNDVAAAIGLAQLETVVEMQANRYARYDQYAAGFEGKVRFLRHDKMSGRSLFVIRVRNRDELHDRLKDEGITTGVHYKPLYRHAALAGCPRSSMVNTEAAADEILSLPMFPSLTEEECERVVKATLRYAVG